MLIDMGKPEHFEILKDRAIFRPVGQISIGRAVEMVTTAIAFARTCRIRNLFVDMSTLTGFEPPRIASRYFFVHDWARAAGNAVRVVLVARPELIDPEKFGSTVAANVGFTADIFSTEEEALAWLQN